MSCFYLFNASAHELNEFELLLLSGKPSEDDSVVMVPGSLKEEESEVSQETDEVTIGLDVQLDQEDEVSDVIIGLDVQVDHEEDEDVMIGLDVQLVQEEDVITGSDVHEDQELEDHDVTGFDDQLDQEDDDKDVTLLRFRYVGVPETLSEMVYNFL